jgi:hypothetical protein
MPTVTKITTGDIIKPLLLALLVVIAFFTILAHTVYAEYPWDTVRPGSTRLSQLDERWGKPIEVVGMYGGGKTYVYRNWRFLGLAKYGHIYVYALDESDIVQVISIIPYSLSIDNLYHTYGDAFSVGSDRNGTQYMLNSSLGIFAEYHGGKIDFLCLYNTEWIFKEGWYGSRYVSEDSNI